MKFKTITIVIVTALVIAGAFAYFAKNPLTERLVFPDGGIYEGSESSFSFEYPENLSVTKLDDPDGEMILLSEKEKGGVIQIYITEGEEGLVITPEILKKDIPELQNVAMALVEVNPFTQGVLFSEGTSNDVKNLWFATGDRVYQITFFSEFEETVVLMTNSLKAK